MPWDDVYKVVKENDYHQEYCTQIKYSSKTNNKLIHSHINKIRENCSQVELS